MSKANLETCEHVSGAEPGAAEPRRAVNVDDKRLIHELAKENNELQDTVHNLRLYLTAAIQDLRDGLGLCDSCEHSECPGDDEPCRACRHDPASSGYVWQGLARFTGMPGYVPVDSESALAAADRRADSDVATGALAPA